MINPFQVHLTVLQQEGYDPFRLIAWWIKHPLTFNLSSKKGLITTPKVRLIVRLSLVVLFIVNTYLFFTSRYQIMIYFDLFSLVCPIPLLLLSLLIIYPYEKINRFLTIRRIRKIITSLDKLKVVGITGSYGKTSVKDYLYSILSSYSSTVKTPESYNTVFGIKKVVDFELTAKTRFFVCEMGAYCRGEIRELVGMVPPDFSIITSIGSQHLERFKTISNTTLAKFEIAEQVKPSNVLVNLDNPHIVRQLTHPKYHGVLTYSLADKESDFFTHPFKLDSTGVKFTINHSGRAYEFSSSLFGTSNLYNLTAAISMALMLDVPYAVIKKQVSLIKPPPHRLELKKIGRAVLIDNAFSSNEEGFASLVSDLSRIKGKKMLITPGIVELGKQTAVVHQRLGELCSDVFEKIILVGRSERTENLQKGLRGKIKQNVTYIDNSTNLWPIVAKHANTHDWILIENDLPDTY